MFILLFIIQIVKSCVHDEIYDMKKDIYNNYNLRYLKSREIKSLKNNTSEFKNIRIKFIYLNSTWIDENYYPKYKMNIIDIVKILNFRSPFLNI